MVHCSLYNTVQNTEKQTKHIHVHDICNGAVCDICKGVLSPNQDFIPYIEVVSSRIVEENRLPIENHPPSANEL